MEAGIYGMLNKKKKVERLFDIRCTCTFQFENSSCWLLEIP